MDQSHLCGLHCCNASLHFWGGYSVTYAVLHHRCTIDLMQKHKSSFSDIWLWWAVITIAGDAEKNSVVCLFLLHQWRNWATCIFPCLEVWNPKKFELAVLCNKWDLGSALNSFSTYVQGVIINTFSCNPWCASHSWHSTTGSPSQAAILSRFLWNDVTCDTRTRWSYVTFQCWAPFLLRMWLNCTEIIYICSLRAQTSLRWKMAFLL